MTSLSRLLQTLRWLSARQIAAQLWHRIQSRTESPEKWAERPIPQGSGVRWVPVGDFLPAGAQRNGADTLRAGEFCFLNRCEEVGWPPRWNDLEVPRLWEYNLHYFEILWALSYAEARQLALDWIAQHGLARGRAGWEPYPVSLRLMNWCGYFLGRHRADVEADSAFQSALWESIYLQAEWLAAHLELHLRGNHLFENAAALTFCGACFSGDDAEGWQRVGETLLTQELSEQVLVDGGHFERSPMYQARVVYVLATLANAGSDTIGRLVEKPLANARLALANFCHPDGKIALFNDSAFGISNPAEQLTGLDASPRSFALRETGYYGARSDEGHYVICDAAPIGPDYIPGHAHGDIFSFELSLAGRRFIVDSGVHDYEVGELRSYCRSTKAHNTVELNGQDQCEFWAAFRVARRGRPRDVAWRDLADGFELEGWHDGYERLRGRPRHRRRFRWYDAGVLLVRDTVTSQRPVAVRSRLHFHPGCTLEKIDEKSVRVRKSALECRVVFDGPGELTIEPSTYCPEFGIARESRALLFTSHGENVESGFCVVHGADDVAYDLSSGAHRGADEFGW